MSIGIALLFLAKIWGGGDNQKDRIRTNGTDRTDMVWGLVIVADVLVIEGLGDNADELVGDVVGEEVAKIHDGGVVFSGEPRLLFALSFSADVAFITSWNLFTSTEILPKAVFEEGLA